MPQNAPKSPALIPTPDEVALLTSLGFRDVNHSKKPEWPDFVWLGRQNAAFLTISITAHIIGEPMWRKYRLALYLNVYCGHESELLTQKAVTVKVSSIADALRFLGLNHETAASRDPGVRFVLSFVPRLRLPGANLQTIQQAAQLPMFLPIHAGGNALGHGALLATS